MSEQPSQKPMHSDIEFTNLGKINKANIKIRPFTVIAGCNSSGKSFITKSLYSLFSGGIGHSIESINLERRESLCKELSYITKNFSATIYRRIYTEQEINELLELAVSFGDDIELLRAFDSVTFNSPETLLLLNDIETKLGNLSKAANSLVEASIGLSRDDLWEIEKSYVNTRSAEMALKMMRRYYDNPKVEFMRMMSDRLTESMSDNFTVPSTNQLIKFDKKDDGARVVIDGNGTLFLTSEVGLNVTAISNIQSLNDHPPIYLESPAYWKLADALEESKKALIDTATRRQLDKNQLVSQVPKYFFDVMDLLDDQVKTTVFSDVVQTIEEAISGSLSINDGGIQYTDKASSASVSLSLTASGVTNLGMIALLLKRGAILPGTFLFIDEPEVHLHPAWQVVLVDVLHQLSKRGVNVVIASHSIDIMKAVENIMENDDEIDPQEHFGINQLTNDGYSVDDTDNNSKRIAAIKQDLGKPFYDMFLGA